MFLRRFFTMLCLAAILTLPVQAEQQTKYVALTFDDGPSGRFTRRLLEGLEANHAHATFFLCGYRLEDYGELAQDIRRGGHEIGLHGYSHDSMANMSAGTLSRELSDTLARLPEGCVVNVMRPPGGAAGGSVAQVAKERNLSIVSWSVDPKDWADHDAELVYRRLLEQTEDGDVILMHDMSDSSVDAALRLVEELHRQGYQMLTVSQLAMLRLTQLKPGAVYHCFPAENVKHLQTSARDACFLSPG